MSLRDSLVVVGVSHRTAPVELREQLAPPADGLGVEASALTRLPAVREAFLVATCNRIEVYASAEPKRAADCAASIRTYFARRAPGSDVGACLYEHRDEAALRHLFRVVASLDSMVVGEPQILGQVKGGAAAARSSGALGPSLSRTTARAFSAAKRVRTETALGSGRVSVASVAVDMAAQIFGDLAGHKVLLLGAGKMALGAARSLVQAGATLTVANRSYERAEALARARGGEAHPLEAVPMLLERADVVLCSTGATRFVVTLEMLQSAMRARRGRPLFLIDIAVPRNVDPRAHGLDAVYLFDVDDLEREVARALGGRGGAMQAAERIVEEELRALEAEQRAGVAVPTIAALRTHVRGVAHAELARSLGGKLKHLGPDERKALETMVEAMASKLLHAPTSALRAQAGTDEGTALAAITRALFQLPDAAAGPEDDDGGARGGGSA